MWMLSLTLHPDHSTCCGAFAFLVAGAVMLGLGASNLGVASSLDASADFNDLGTPTPSHARPFVGLSRPRSWSHFLVFVGKYRQKLINLIEIDF